MVKKYVVFASTTNAIYNHQLAAESPSRFPAGLLGFCKEWGRAESLQAKLRLAICGTLAGVEAVVSVLDF